MTREQMDQLAFGKSEPYIPLSQHMMSAGACAVAYLRAKSSKGILEMLGQWMNLDENGVVLTVAYLFALHDIGKAHPSFQYSNDEIRQKWEARGCDIQKYYPCKGFRHECRSRIVVQKLWKEGAFPPKTARLFASVLRLHHQGKADSNEGKEPDPMWWEIVQELEARIRSVFPPEQIKTEVKNCDALGAVLTGLLVLCDWVASSKCFGTCDAATDDAFCNWAIQRAEETLQAYGLISDLEDAFPYGVSFDEFWKAIPREQMRPVQIACEKMEYRKSALTIIEAPPGEGKTEAALYAAGRLCKAWKKHGIYMALPTAATSNQMVDRVRRLMDSQQMGKVRLLHGTAWMMEDFVEETATSLEADDAADAAKWLLPLRRAMLSENAVGTVDQAMSAALRIKYGLLRVLGLANKVLIIDEIHAYDAYMSRIITRLLQWCRKLEIPVILLSATMHRSQRLDYISCFSDHPGTKDELSPAYPLITQVDREGNVYQHPVAGAFMHTSCGYQKLPLLNDIEGLAHHVLERTQHGGCFCVMMNTVKRAQAVYRALQNMGETCVMLFHAKYRMRRRMEIERMCLKLFSRGGERPKRMILVCTQVVEQSLDLDFDGMICDLAPVDLLIQRAGRIHRHCENFRPKGMETPLLEIIVPDETASSEPEQLYGVLSAVYAVFELYNTETWLGNGQVVRVPEDVRSVVETVYENFDDTHRNIYVMKQVNNSISQVAADGVLLRSPKAESFFGQIPSSCHFEVMDASERPMFASGAKTREGEESLQVAFLPADFDCTGTDRELARKIWLESASVPLTFPRSMSMIENKVQKNFKEKKSFNNKGIGGCVIAQLEADGSYTVRGKRFLVNDELGILEATADDIDMD